MGKCDPARSNEYGHRGSANDYHKQWDRSSLNLMAFHSHQVFGPESDTPFVSKLQQHILGTRRHLASDPRDKVYGLLGLVDENSEECIPDYKKNVIQVYTDVVVSYIHATNKFASIYLKALASCMRTGSRDYLHAYQTSQLLSVRHSIRRECRGFKPFSVRW